MKPLLLTSLGCSALILGACTTYVQPDPYGPEMGPEPRTPRFGANGTQSTLVTETTTQRRVSTPTPDVSVADPQPRTSPDRPSRTTTTSTSSSPSATSSTSTTTSSTPSPNTTATSSVERKTALPHPDPELVRNPFNPSGPPLRIKNLSSGRADYQTGDEVMPDASKPNQRVVIP